MKKTVLWLKDCEEIALFGNNFLPFCKPKVLAQEIRGIGPHKYWMSKTLDISWLRKQPE